MGDFNSALFIEDTYYGSSKMNISMREFSECVENVEVADVNSTGLQYTWNQKPKGDFGILKKIDRVMANIEFLLHFLAHMQFFNRIEFLTMLLLSLRFRRHNMFRLVKRLRGMKKPLRKLLHAVKRLRGMKKPLRKLLHAQ
ncbi:RNA-directed DNA polymerase, eukaryota, reverse transcriptase zinc-binding domain protein, partial [Tanacetum coccineum]